MESRKLGKREYMSIAIIMVGAKATDSNPALLYSHVKNAAWMIPLLSAVIFFVGLFLLLKTMELFQGKNLFSVIQHLFGRYIGFFICLVIFLISSFAISFDSRTYTNIIRSYYFTTTPNLIIYAVLMVISAYGAKKGIQNIGSVGYLIVFYTLISLFFALIISIQDSTIQAIFPIWGPGKLVILKQSALKITLFAEFFLLTLLIPNMNSTKEFRKSTWYALAFVSFQISVAIISFICMFDTSLKGIGYPFHTAIGFLSLGIYLPNIEIFFFVIWILAIFVRFAVFIYLNALMFAHIFKINELEFLIPALATIYLLIGSIPENPLEVALFFKQSITNLAGPTFFVISLLLWLVALVKGEFKHAKNRSSM